MDTYNKVFKNLCVCICMRIYIQFIYSDHVTVSWGNGTLHCWSVVTRVSMVRILVAAEPL